MHKRTTVAAAVALASAIFAAPAFAVVGQLGSARFSTLSGPLTPAAYRCVSGSAGQGGIKQPSICRSRKPNMGNCTVQRVTVRSRNGPPYVTYRRVCPKPAGSRLPPGEIPY